LTKSAFERLNEIIAQLDEINTRLDLIEECLGDQFGPWPTELMSVPDKESPPFPHIGTWKRSYDAPSITKTLPFDFPMMDVPFGKAHQPGQDWLMEVSGNSSFEDYEEHHPDPAETTGTHPPDCRCAWCEPQEGYMF